MALAVATGVDVMHVYLKMTSARSEKGLTPLHLAVFANDAKATAALLDAGANPKARDASGKTPFDYAKGIPFSYAISRR